MVVSYILRACPIAGKYATFAHNQLKKVRKVKLTEKEIVDELMMVGWFNQAPHIIEQETYSTMKRQEIDDTIFKISFLEPISKEADEEFLAIAETHKDYYSTCPARELKKCT
jgi:hypothetical protein